MVYEFSKSGLQGVFRLSEDPHFLRQQLSANSKLIHIFWNRQAVPIWIQVDGIPTQLLPNHVTTATYFQQVRVSPASPPLTTFSFNREFYCISDHDEEVSCNGIIFFGAHKIPVIQLDEEEKRKFDLLYAVFLDEFTTHDNIQGEMLAMLLKRLIIKLTRLAKQQVLPASLRPQQADIIRRFHVLVDLHFRSCKRVGEYAEMLNKSSKTLSNLFAKHQQPSPLRMIHERIVLEAKRLLRYSDKTSREIAFELGFEEVATFHKMFKKITKQTPLDFRKSSKTREGEKSTIIRAK
ncbi:MAG: helix-turn-helix domain-containing protein [Bacteroidota bacterium]